MKLILSLFDFCFRTFQPYILNFKLSNQLDKWKFSAINFSSNRWNWHLHILLIMTWITGTAWWEMSFHTLTVISANCQVPSRENFKLCVHFKILYCYLWKLLRLHFLQIVTVWVINKTQVWRKTFISLRWVKSMNVLDNTQQFHKLHLKKRFACPHFSTDIFVFQSLAFKWGYGWGHVTPSMGNT